MFYGLVIGAFIVYAGHQSYTWKLDSYKQRTQMEAERLKWEEARKRNQKGA